MFVMSRMVFGRAIVVAAIAVVGVLMIVSPAWAHGAGVTTNGASTIHAEEEPTAPLCLPFTDRLEINLYNIGSFNNLPGPYETVATFISDQDFWFSPAGTFDNSTCLGEPAAVVGKLRVNNDVTCPSVDATYKRTTSVYEIETTEPTACTIAGGDAHPEEHLLFTGEQTACSDEPPDPCDPMGTPDDDSDNVEFVGDYEQGI